MKIGDWTKKFEVITLDIDEKTQSLVFGGSMTDLDGTNKLPLFGLFTETWVSYQFLKALHTYTNSQGVVEFD